MNATIGFASSLESKLGALRFLPKVWFRETPIVIDAEIARLAERYRTKPKPGDATDAGRLHALFDSYIHDIWISEIPPVT
jgi:hypothetical protein